MTHGRKTFLVSLGVGLVIGIIVFFLNTQNMESLFGRLCDGCFVAAVMVLGAGGLKFASNKGAFDMMGYSLKSVFHIHLPGTKTSNETEDFYDYTQRKAGKRRGASGILLAGLVYLVLASIFLILYSLV